MLKQVFTLLSLTHADFSHAHIVFLHIPALFKSFRLLGDALLTTVGLGITYICMVSFRRGKFAVEARRQLFSAVVLFNC